jgi:hypothetical protein
VGVFSLIRKAYGNPGEYANIHRYLALVIVTTLPSDTIEREPLPENDMRSLLGPLEVSVALLLSVGLITQTGQPSLNWESILFSMTDKFVPAHQQLCAPHIGCTDSPMLASLVCTVLSNQDLESLLEEVAGELPEIGISTYVRGACSIATRKKHR